MIYVGIKKYFNQMRVYLFIVVISRSRPLHTARNFAHRNDARRALLTVAPPANQNASAARWRVYYRGAQRLERQSRLSRLTAGVYQGSRPRRVEPAGPLGVQAGGPMATLAPPSPQHSTAACSRSQQTEPAGHLLVEAGGPTVTAVLSTATGQATF